ncbi:MAG: outer membrane protein, partial [Rhodospirillales bacterium]
MPKPISARLGLGLLLLLCLLLKAPGASAAEPSGWYIAGKGGPSYSAISGVETTGGGTAASDSGANVIGSFGMAGGYEWMHHYQIPLRTELEFMNRTEVTYDSSPAITGAGSSGALSSTAQNVTLMAKGYWHFPVGSRNWWPFVSGGVGLSRNTVKGQYTPSGGSAVKFNEASQALAWSAGIGASFKLGPQVMNDVELRYVDLGSLDWDRPRSPGLEAT